MELFDEHADLLEDMRQYLWAHSVLSASGTKAKTENQTKDALKFNDYLNYAEPIKKIPSHRALALFRGRRENVLQLTLSLPSNPNYGEERIMQFFNVANQQRAADSW